jgi:hypothetical protein
VLESVGSGCISLSLDQAWSGRFDDTDRV